MKKLFSLVLLSMVAQFAKANSPQPADTTYQRYKWDANTYVIAEIRTLNDTAKFYVNLQIYKSNEGFSRDKKTLEKAFAKAAVKWLLEKIDLFQSSGFSGNQSLAFDEFSSVELSKTETENYMVFVLDNREQNAKFRLDNSQVQLAENLLRHIVKRL